MSEVRLVPYDTAYDLDFDLFEVDGVDFRIDAVHAAGDTTIIKDAAAEANTTNGFTDEGNSYSIIITAIELQAKRVTINIVDQTATKVWLDKSIVLETYGHPDAMHPLIGIDVLDFGTAQGGAAGTITLKAGAPVSNDRLNGAVVLVIAGTGDYQARRVTDYDGTTKVATISPDWAVNPDNTSKYYVLPAPPDTTLTVTRLAELDSVNLPTDVDTVLSRIGTPASSLTVLLGTPTDTDLATDLVNLDTLIDQIIAKLTTDTIAEPAQGQPPATPTQDQFRAWLWAKFRNESITSGTEDQIKNDAGTVLAKATVSDAASVFTKQKYVSGP